MISPILIHSLGSSVKMTGTRHSAQPVKGSILAGRYSLTSFHGNILA